MRRQAWTAADMPERRRRFHSWYLECLGKYRRATGRDLGSEAAHHSIVKRRELDHEKMDARDIRHWMRWIVHRMKKQGVAA